MDGARQSLEGEEHRPLDLERFTLVAPCRTTTKKPIPEKPSRSAGRFLKGPVPLPWLIRAGELPGKALLVGMGLWYRAGLTKSRSVKASGTLWEELCIPRHTAYRGVRALEKAGLISVSRVPGRALAATLLTPEDKV